MYIALKEVRSQRTGASGKRLSQEELARSIGMSVGNLRRIESSDVSQVNLETLEKICLALKCQPGDLLILGEKPNE